MVGIFNVVFGSIFSGIFYPFRGFNPWVGMTVISLLTAVLMLVAYRYTSNQEAIRTLKDRIKAHLLELLLYRDNLSATLRSQGKILGYNARYLGHSFRPALVMIVPLVLTVIHLDLWFGYRTLHPGETALVKVRLREGTRPSSLSAALDADAGVVADTPALRIDRDGEIDWRVRATKPGTHELSVRIGGERVAKQVVVDASPLSPVSASRVAAGLGQLLSPGEDAIPSGSIVRSIEVFYPALDMKFIWWAVPWWLAYLLLTIVLGFALKGLFGVEI